MWDDILSIVIDFLIYGQVAESTIDNDSTGERRVNYWRIAITLVLFVMIGLTILSLLGWLK